MQLQWWGITIRIFVKGLKNVHSWLHMYEKGPQMLTDIILEVEKLNTTQQLTATIILPSMVNGMSHKEYFGFQCQEQGYIARNCPHIRCYECNKYGHIVMDCPHKIPPLGTPATHHKPHRSHHTRPSLRHHCEDRDRQSQSRSQSHFQRHHSLSHHYSHRSTSRLQHQDRCSHHRSSSQQSCSTHWGHSHRPHCDTPHWSHQKSSQHRSSSSFQSQQHSRSHSQLAYRSSSHELHWSSTQSSRTRWQSHPKKNMRWRLRIHTWTITALIITPVTQGRNQIL